MLQIACAVCCVLCKLQSDRRLTPFILFIPLPRSLNSVLHTVQCRGLTAQDNIVALNLTYGSTKKMLVDLANITGAQARLAQLPFHLPSDAGMCGVPSTPVSRSPCHVLCALCPVYRASLPRNKH